MKKALSILITVCLLASLFVSCDNNARIDELVSVSFDASDARALVVSNEAFIGFDNPSIEWQYKASKVTNDTYNVGAAATWKAIPGETDEDAGKITNVVEFSQGKWNFELRAIKKNVTSEVVVYYGQTEEPVLLTKQEVGRVYNIPINLTAQLDGQKGYIVLSNISVKHLSSGEETLDSPSKVFIDGSLLTTDKYTSTGTSISTASTGLEYTVGTHKVKVQKIGENGEILAEEEKTIEVYAGLKTTISNWIVEITQGGQFAPVAPTGTTTVSVPDSGDSLTLTVANVSPSMTSGNGTSVTIPKTVLGSATSATVNVAVKQATEASSDDSFTISSESSVAVAAIDLTLTATESAEVSSIVTTFTSPVTVSTVIAKGLSNVIVTYNGTTDDISDVNYNPTDGNLSFKTTHFSTFVVESSSVAIVGDTAYETLDAAINAANSGATITLLKDSIGNGIGSKDKGKAEYRESLTIDFNGHTYTMNDPAVGSTGTETQAMHWGDSLGSITLKNGTFMVAENTSRVAMAMQNYINFTADNMTFDFRNIPVVHYGDSEFTGANAIYNSLEVPMVGNNRQGKINLNNCTVHMPDDSSKGICNDGQVIEVVSSTVNGAFAFESAGKAVKVKDSTVTKGVIPYFDSGYFVATATDEEGYTIYTNNERPVIAKIGNTKYYTLEDAIGAANDGDTIVLNSDISMTLTEGSSCISITSKNITINGNDKTIELRADKANSSTYGISIFGDSEESGKTVTIKNTKIITTNIERAVVTNGNSGIVIDGCEIETNGVGVNIKGSTTSSINNTKITVKYIDNFNAHKTTGILVSGANADVTVNGSTIKAVNYNKAVKPIKPKDSIWTHSWCKGLYVGTSGADAKLTVNNTTVIADFSIAIDGTESCGANRPGTIKINSGNYNGLIGSTGYMYKTVIINGGTFTDIKDFGSFYGKDDAIAKLVINGGSFDIEPDKTKYIPDGYLVSKENDMWSVKKSTTN